MLTLMSVEDAMVGMWLLAIDKVRYALVRSYARVWLQGRAWRLYSRIGACGARHDAVTLCKQQGQQGRLNLGGPTRPGILMCIRTLFAGLRPSLVRGTHTIGRV